MICEVCGKEFESRRKTAKYCSAKCRKLAFQGKKVSVPGSEVSVPVVTDSDQVKDAIRTLKVRKKNRDRDDFFSPDYDLSEAGFIRRNKNWLDSSSYPGTSESREACMEAVSQAHAKRMREIYG